MSLDHLQLSTRQTYCPYSGRQPLPASMLPDIGRDLTFEDYVRGASALESLEVRAGISDAMLSIMDYPTHETSSVVEEPPTVSLESILATNGGKQTAVLALLRSLYKRKPTQVGNAFRPVRTSHDCK